VKPDWLLDRPDCGEFCWMRERRWHFDSELTRLRAEKIGFIFQHFHMIPYLTSGRERHAGAILPQQTDEDEALEVLCGAYSWD